MNEKVLKTLEYNKILNQLSEYACSPEAKKRCLALRPITDKAQIEQLQLQTKDALSRLFRCGNLSFSGVHSVNDSLKRLEIGASLSAAAFSQRTRLPTTQAAHCVPSAVPCAA